MRLTPYSLPPFATVVMGSQDYSLTTASAPVTPGGQGPLQILLPSPGWYRIGAAIQVQAGASANDAISATLVDVTNSVVIATRTNRSLAASDIDQLTLTGDYHVSGATTIAVYAQNATASRGAVQGFANAPGATYIGYSPSWAPIGIAPTISSFAPYYGTSVSVTITGAGFTGATSVTFGGVPVAFTVNSDTQITATSPSAITFGAIQVTGRGGTGTSPINFYPKLPASVSPTGLALFLPMMEGSGTSVGDASSYARSFAISGSATWTTDNLGYPAIALPTTATANISGTDANMPTGNRTMAVKFNTSVALSGKEQELLTYGKLGSSTNASALYLGPTPGGALFASQWGSSVHGSTPVNDGVWHVGVATASGNSWSVYVDGTLAASGTMTTATILNGGAYMGYIPTIRNNYGATYSWAAAWNRVLSSTEIAALR